MGLTAECTIPSALCDILDAKAERFAALPPFYKSVNVEPLQSNLPGYLVSWLLFEPLDQTDQGRCGAVLHPNPLNPSFLDSLFHGLFLNLWIKRIKESVELCFIQIFFILYRRGFEHFIRIV